MGPIRWPSAFLDVCAAASMAVCKTGHSVDASTAHHIIDIPFKCHPKFG
jgi:hypothetical protein